MSTATTHTRKSGVQMLIPALSLVVLLGAGCSDKETTPPQEVAPVQAPAPQAVQPVTPPPVEATTPPPVEAPTPAAMPEEPQTSAEPPAATETAAADGQKVYQASCQACHALGIAGAPKLGDKEAWAPRIAKGKDALLTSVNNGLNAMPPKGACMSCSEEDLSSAIDYMVGQGS